MDHKTILLAEDDADQRELYTYLLKINGYEVTSVGTGREALRELQHCLPDLILTDIAMPDINGLELVKEVKSRAEYANVPIVVMTNFNRYYLQWAATVGANGTITKPFDPDELLATISNTLSNSP